jgi:hypothetical protein
MPSSTVATPVTCAEPNLDVTDLYQTVPLDPVGDQIRLIEIISGSNDALQCRFHCVSLSDKPQYVALSYAWGPPPAIKSIWIDGHEILIRENLWLFCVRRVNDAGSGLLRTYSMDLEHGDICGLMLSVSTKDP